MSLPHLSLADARNLHLAAQGLLNKPRRRASLEDIPGMELWVFSVPNAFNSN